MISIKNATFFYGMLHFCLHYLYRLLILILNPLKAKNIKIYMLIFK